MNCVCGRDLVAKIIDIKLKIGTERVPGWVCTECGLEIVTKHRNRFLWAQKFEAKTNSLIYGFDNSFKECVSCGSQKMVAASEFFLSGYCFPFHTEYHPGWLCPACGFMDRVTNKNKVEWVTYYKGWRS